MAVLACLRLSCSGSPSEPSSTPVSLYVMPGSRKFFQMGSKFDYVFCVFLVDEGKGGSKYNYMPANETLLNGVSLTDDGQPLNAGLAAL